MLRMKKPAFGSTTPIATNGTKFQFENVGSYTCYRKCFFNLKLQRKTDLLNLQGLSSSFFPTGLAFKQLARYITIT